jgi:hypothetical protein
MWCVRAYSRCWQSLGCDYRALQASKWDVESVMGEWANSGNQRWFMMSWQKICDSYLVITMRRAPETVACQIWKREVARLFNGDAKRWVDARNKPAESVGLVERGGEMGLGEWRYDVWFSWHTCVVWVSRLLNCKLTNIEICRAQ